MDCNKTDQLAGKHTGMGSPPFKKEGDLEILQSHVKRCEVEISSWVDRSSHQLNSCSKIFNPVPVSSEISDLREISDLFNLIYLFMSRHEIHSMNTHTQQNAGW